MYLTQTSCRKQLQSFTIAVHQQMCSSLLSQAHRLRRTSFSEERRGCLTKRKVARWNTVNPSRATCSKNTPLPVGVSGGGRITVNITRGAENRVRGFASTVKLQKRPLRVCVDGPQKMHQVAVVCFASNRHVYSVPFGALAAVLMKRDDMIGFMMGSSVVLLSCSQNSWGQQHHLRLSRGASGAV